MLIRRFVAVVLVAALASCGGAYAQSAAAQRRPKLVVILVVDQMRADYAEKFSKQWTGGLKRLLEEGAWFRNAAYPYMNTVTCPGHATISTGSVPATHGIVMNSWFDRAEGNSVSCTEDPSQKSISYGREAVSGGHSPWRLQVPTFSDELRAQQSTPGRVVTFSLKTRSAMMLAGHRGDAVTWFDEPSGNWVTSTAYTSAQVPFVAEFVKQNPVTRDYGKIWQRLLPKEAYLYEDDAAGEKPGRGWGRTFPHVLDSESGQPDAAFFRHWCDSPYSDDYLGKMAMASIDALQLGSGPAVDFLGVSFSALDFVGHSFGPRSHEVQDMLARVDRTIGELLAHLDKTVGPGNYVVALSADHGLAPIPEQMAALGFDAGRVVNVEVANRVDRALELVWGPGKYVSRMTYPDLYFQPGIYERLQKDPAVMQVVINAILGVPGVWRVFRGEELWHARNTDDSVGRAAALSYYAGRSGDMVVMPKPYWFFTGSREPSPGGTTHGTSHDYDARVPIIFFGHGIKPGEYLTPAMPTDIAPTLAFLCGLTLASPDGRILTEALEPTPRRAPAKH